MMKRLLLFFALCSWLVGTTSLWAESHTANYFVNGVKIFSETVEEDAALAFPADDSSIKDDLELVGWSQSEMASTSNAAPADMVTSATMGNADVNYYAVFAEPRNFRLTKQMMAVMKNQVASADESHYYTPYPDYNEDDIIHWYFKGIKDDQTSDIGVQIGAITSPYDYYIGIETPYTISKVTLGVKNSTGNQYFHGKLFLRTAPNETDAQKELDFAKINSMVAEFVPEVDRNKFYVQASIAARIYAIKVTCGYINYRTTLDTYVATIGESGYGTICLPWNAAVPEGLTVFRLFETILSKDMYQLRFTDVEGLAASKGYLTKGTPGTYEFRRIYFAPTDANETNMMLGVTESTNWSTMTTFANNASLKPFILNKDANFIQYTGTNIPACKAFVALNPDDINFAAGAAGLRISLVDKDEVVTGLSECIESRSTTPAVYDLTGKQVPQIKRGGLYIVNGKSVLVK